MNSAIAMLTHEHKLIMKVVNALGAISNDLAHGSSVSSEKLHEIVRFLREFADKCHHAKEEDILFPEMAKHGVPETGCPLAALRLEHVHARQLVAQLSTRTQAYARREAGAANALMAVITDIGNLYSSHIWKEDNMVFPMVDRLFPPQDIEHLFQRFEQAEVELGQDHEDLERFAKSLEQAHSAPGAAA